MKHLISLLLFASSLSLPAAVPLRWTVETSSANPATFDQFAGATYDLEASLQSHGKPLAVEGDAQLFWQTNGMGSAWWTAPASITNLTTGQSVNQTILKATWLPSYDVGARAYNCFIGITGTVYNAAFQLRLRPSPGATPNELPLPQTVIDFSRVTVLNPPWTPGGGGGTNTNDVKAVVDAEVGGTNAVKAAVAAVPHLVSATNDLSSSVSGLASSKRDKTDLKITEPKNVHWVWTSNDPNRPEGWLDAANSYGAAKPERTHSPIDGWYCRDIDGKACESPVYGTDGDLSVSLFFSPGKDGNPFLVVATRDSATNTTPVEVETLALVSQLPAADQLLTAEQRAAIADIPKKLERADVVDIVHGSTTNLFRSFGDEYVYEPDGFSDFTWNGDRRDAVAAIGDMQPTQVGTVGEYTSWVIAFEMDDHYYWGDAHALTAAPEVTFSFYADWYDESTGEWIYDSLELTAVRHVTGYHRTNPIDTFARQSRLEAVAGSVDGLRNRIDGETKVLRTGADGERGSGWGYLQTSLDGDYRNWRFRVPEWVGVTGSATNDTTASQTYVTWTNGNQRSVGYNVILRNPLSWSPAWCFDRTVSETRGAQGVDAVQQADYDVGLLRKSQTVSGGSTYYLNYTVSQNAGMAVKTSLVESGWTATNRVYWLGSGGSGTFVTVPGHFRPIREHVSRTWTYGSGDGYEDVATFEADATGLFVRADDLVDWYVTSASFKFSVVCETERVMVVRIPESGDPETLLDETINWAYHSVEVSATRISSTTFEDAFAPYYKLVGTLDYGIFYDEEKDCSWQIKVRNGCFYSEKYCDGDWRR